jgi:hypothetical protein
VAWVCFVTLGERLLRMTTLNLNKFPAIEHVHGLLWYDPFREFPDLDKLGDISERIYGCAHFIGASSDEKYPFFSENKTLRAFLNEFSSLSEILKDHDQSLFHNLAIEKTDFPVFHFLKLLRNVNFHVKSISGGSISYQATLYNTTTHERYGDEMTITNYIIADCNLTLLKNARDIKHYNQQEMQDTIEWIDRTQKQYGFSDILEAALRQYCKLINHAIANNQ